MTRNKYNSTHLFALYLILGCKVLAMVLFILFGNIGLGPDEAQYWTWSQELDWGYYSKPPGIAWQIWLGTAVVGNTELGVRLLSIIFSFCLSLSVYYLAIAAKTQSKTAFWAAIVIAFSPLGILSSLFAITDGGMVLCWTLACIVLARALSQETAPNYYLLGLILLVGALFKWPIYLLWGIIVILFFFYPFLYRKSFFIGVVISLLGLLPSVIWNSTHDWGTFRHVFATIQGGSRSQNVVSEGHSGNLLEFLGSQAALLSPIFFVLLLLSLIFFVRRFKMIPTAALKLCGAIPLLLLMAFIVLSIFQKVQGNWCDFVYPTAIVFLSWYACEQMRSGVLWLKIGTGLSIIMCVVIFSIPFIQEHSLFPAWQIPYKINPFKHNLGWHQLNQTLSEAGYDEKEHFLFGDKYQTSSILSFYGPGQKRAYFLNLHGIRHNQFSFWPGMPQEQMGKTGFFVLTENMPHFEKGWEKHLLFYQDELGKYFKSVEFLGVYPLFESYGKFAKGAIVYKCVEYNGEEPPTVNLY